jgi:lipoprotein-anchoring transpeptidase ErfK/SrfK
MRLRRGCRRWSLVAFGAALLLLAAAPASSASGQTVKLPAAGELITSRAVVRAAPAPTARALRVLHRLRPDGQFAIVLAISTRRGTDGHQWYELSLPGRPNGQRGWVRDELLDLHTVANRIVVRVGERRIFVRRIADNRLLVSGVVAVGKPGAETPLGRDFYVQGRFVPRDPFFGRFVLETSAYSKLSDWPGGGLAGIHGTNQPQLLGQAVSHGCVRVSDPVARALERLAPLGTPIDLLP